jgi:histidinol phosphatase-like PHP family hydrolase
MNELGAEKLMFEAADPEVFAWYTLDYVVASVHSHFDLDEKRMTDRLLVAIRSGVVQ